MKTVVVNKWGNSQGIVIPKTICEQADIHIGDRLGITVGQEGEIVIHPQQASKYQRSPQRITIDELFAGYEAGQQSPEPDWGRSIGHEMDW